MWFSTENVRQTKNHKTTVKQISCTLLICSYCVNSSERVINTTLSGKICL